MKKPDQQTSEPQTSLIPLSDSTEVLSPGALGAIAQAEAEVKAAVAMAIRYPRDWDSVREKLLHECQRPVFALGRKPGTGALYAKPIGNGQITGLSIRFAEAAISAAGHIHVTVRSLSETDEQRKLSVKVWDAQNQVSFADEVTIDKVVERKIIPKGAEILRTRLNKQGELLYIVKATGDDLLNKENALKSKSIRNSALRLLPGWLTDECRDVLEATIKARDKEDPDAAKHQILDAFSKLGVSVDQIKKFLGHDAGTISPDELLQLRGLYTGLRDGETTIAAVFEELEQEKEKSKIESIRDRLRDRKKVAGPAAPSTEPTEAPTPPESEAPTTPAPSVTEYGSEGGFHTAEGTVLDTSSGRGKHFVTLKDGRKFRLPNLEMSKSARQRIGSKVIIHYQVEGEDQIVALIENE